MICSDQFIYAGGPGHKRVKKSKRRDQEPAKHLEKSFNSIFKERRYINKPNGNSFTLFLIPKQQQQQQQQQQQKALTGPNP